MKYVDKNAALKINNVSVSFDGFFALSEVDVTVLRKTVHFFIGPNGAGKTTLLDIICAKTKPTAGTVFFYPRGRERVRLTGMEEYEIVREGVVRKFQTPSVFASLSVVDNMVLSLKGQKGIFESLFRQPSLEDFDLIYFTLEKVGLLERSAMKAGALAHGEKQWLEIAMQLVQEPELIMLDEPAAGMGKAETYKTGEILTEIKRDCTVVVVEHDMEFVKQTADTVTVLHEGRVLTEGGIDQVLADKTVQTVYLGRGNP